MLFLVQFAVAQDIDSTIVFETEQVVEFQKQTIVEEYYNLYDSNTNIKRILRIGINENSTGTRSYQKSTFPFEVSFLNKVGKNSAILVGLTGSRGLFSYVSINAQVGFRKFISSVRHSKEFAFTGNYIGIQSSIDLSNFPKATFIHGSSSSLQAGNLPYYDSRSTVGVLYGLQLGGTFDLAIQAGVKRVGRGKVDEYSVIDYDNSRLIPFFSTNSLLSFSLNDGNKSIKPTCEFLNCNRLTNQLLKLDISNLVYLDPFMGNLSIGGAFEKRILQSNFSFNVYSQLNLGYTRGYDQKINHVPSDSIDYGIYGITPVIFYNPTSYFDFTYNANFGSELRYYPLKRREINNGKSVQNFNGFYIKTLAEFKLSTLSKHEDYLILYYSSRNNIKSVVFEYGGGIGYQKKVGSKYYYDLFIDSRKTDSPNIQFKDIVSFNVGSRFGIAK